MSRYISIGGMLCSAGLLLWAGVAFAEPSEAEPLPAIVHHSATITGPLGLNTVPSARMDPAGTVRVGVGTLDPYAHGWIGLQLVDPLWIGLRQSAEVSNLNDNADRLYPGVDLKLRLLKENRSRPEIAIGLQSAIGHKRMSGEYLALSKRYKSFDLTTGLGWGRYGSAAHFKNPLKVLSDHFGGDRFLDGEMPNEPAKWFTGDDVGLFAGVEYFTPIDGLSFKFDYGADRYSAERAALDYNAPAPWAVGLNYQPASWIDMSIGAQGTDKIMGRISLQNLIQNWRDKDANTDSAILRPYRTGLALPGEMETAAAGDDVRLYDVQASQHSAEARLMLRPDLSTPRQLSQAAIHMANHAGKDIEKLSITPTLYGLQGPQVSLMRADLEAALAQHNGSAEEIWHKAEFNPSAAMPFTKLKRPPEYGYGLSALNFKLDNQISLSEEDQGVLYRTSFVVGGDAPDFFGLIDSFYSFRLNLKDNLHHLNELRPRALLPVRSNVDEFADRRFALDTYYAALTHSFRPDLHVSLLGGYLEEMYGGFGGEILYRPFNSRFAIGAESWFAFKRDPDTTLNLGFNGDHLLTGHINGWYDLPNWDLTLNAGLGRYLGEDIGGTLGLQKRFHNGAMLEGFVTITDQSDFDLFGGTTHAYNGLRLSLPLGGFEYIPRNTSMEFQTAPFGRDTGQRLVNPLSLYELSENFTARHMEEYWSDITE